MLDPFAGTGSIVLAAAHFGATAWGSEIHPPTLRGRKGQSGGGGGQGQGQGKGKGKGQSACGARANFEQ
jgi:tRNA G10  N-methylase Trm11